MHRVRSSVMLLGIGLAVMLALFIASGGTKTEPAFAGATDFDGIYDVNVNDGSVDEAPSLFHCITSIDHNSAPASGDEDVDANILCYIDTPGLGPGSPLVDTADVVPGPPPPPPYSTAAPSALTGTYNEGTDDLTLNGCFGNVGGTIGPNVIVHATFGTAGAQLGAGNISGTVDIFSNQSIANCATATEDAGDTPFLNDQPVNLHKAGTAGQASWRSSATNFDADSCTDANELATNIARPEACGDDPYNPNDSVTDYSGPVSIQATAIAADWNDTTEVLIPGSYFHCLGNTDHNTGTNAITTTVQCYTDSPAIGGASGSGLPGSGDGLPGAPTPRIGVRAATGFTSAEPTVNTGSYSPGTGDITTTGCFESVGPPLGPNVITTAVIDATTGEGTVQIYFAQTNANCAAKTPQGTPAITGLLEVASQNTSQDSDGDGCTDADEVLSAASCGDDPYNKWDGDGLTDGALTGVYSLSFTAIAADRDGVEDTGGDAGGANSCYDGIDNGGGDGADGADPNDCKVIPGQYSHCMLDAVFASGVMSAPSICYTDSSALGTPGDGLPGAPPPNNPATDPTGASLVNPVTARRVITGTLTGSTLATVQCFQDVDLPPTGPTNNVDVGTTASINAYTGHGTDGVITFYDRNTNCTNNPVPVFSGALIDIAPQGPRYAASPAPSQTANSVDTDRDGCRDDQETKGPGTQAAGGARDPFNRWDSMDQYTGSPLAKDRLIAVGDIGAVVGRFGTNDMGGAAPVNRNSDPNVAPALATGYHPVADRSGAVIGANPWNLKLPDGTVAVGDIGAVVGQFGHSCTGS